MKKQSLIILGILMLASSTFAQGEAFDPRRGFMIGFGLGGGGISLHDSGNSLNKGAFIGNFRIGGGISERLILMGESHGAVTHDNGADISVSSLLFSAQYFLTDGFYIRPGIGFAIGQSVSTSGGITFTSTSDTGFSMNAASGFEFRLTKSFALAPEFDVNYAHIEGTECVSYGAVLNLSWYL